MTEETKIEFEETLQDQLRRARETEDDKLSAANAEVASKLMQCMNSHEEKQIDAELSREKMEHEKKVEKLKLLETIFGTSLLVGVGVYGEVKGFRMVGPIAKVGEKVVSTLATAFLKK